MERGEAKSIREASKNRADWMPAANQFAVFVQLRLQLHFPFSPAAAPNPPPHTLSTPLRSRVAFINWMPKTKLRATHRASPLTLTQFGSPPLLAFCVFVACFSFCFLLLFLYFSFFVFCHCCYLTFRLPTGFHWHWPVRCGPQWPSMGLLDDDLALSQDWECKDIRHNARTQCSALSRALTLSLSRIIPHIVHNLWLSEGSFNATSPGDPFKYRPAWNVLTEL